MESVLQICRSFILSDNDLVTLRDKMKESMTKGLRPRTRTISGNEEIPPVKMLPSYVYDQLPDKCANSTCIALDLGGTNFRVLLFHLNDGQIEMDSQIYSIPPRIMTGQGVELFDHIAQCISDFLHRKHLQNDKIYCGFTFSFPVAQSALNSANLITWTKGFKATEVEGNDVVELLQDSIAKRGDIDVEILAVLNDTVGTMMSCAFEDSATEIGLIAGTGSNACYVENCANIHSIGFDENDKNKDGQMVINTEWGGFGDKGALDQWITKYDREIDANSVNPGKQIYEKMIAGMYLVLCDMAQQGLILSAESLLILEKRDAFPSFIVSQIIENKPRNFIQIQNILASMDILAERTDCEIIYMVCDTVSRRAAYMCAAGVAAIALKIADNRPNQYCDLTCGVDGSVYRKHPTFASLIQVKTNELVGLGVHVTYKMSHDGSGKGAALITSVVESTRRKSLLGIK